MEVRNRFPREAWIPLAAGLFWLWHAPGHGFVGFFFSVIPGCLLLGSGVSMLLMPGDRRIAQFTALGGVLGMVFALPAFFVVGFVSGCALVGVSAASAVAAGVHSVAVEPSVDRVPVPRPSLALAAQVAVDEALLSTVMLTNPIPRLGDHPRIEGEIAAARALYASRGWLDKPADYHVAPPPLERPAIRSASVRSLDYEHLSFDSDYEPHPDEPGGERWLGYAANRRAHAWVKRHADAPRPWLVCIHGYQMGFPLYDLTAFAPEYFHHRLGLNMLVPVLPLHGPRKVGKRSGDGFIGAETLDTVHAEAQAMWDIRRMLSWVRSEGEAGIGVLGLSLGGYNAALLACLDDDLRCAIPGIPATDLARVVFTHAPPLQLQDVRRAGIDIERTRETLRVVSPLVLEPIVAPEHRAIFAAVADRLVPPDQPRDLWEHWGQPRIEWYQGAHVTFRAHAGVRHLVVDTLRGAGLAV